MHYVVLFDPGYATVYVDDTVGRCAIVVCENKIHFQSRLVATFPSIDTQNSINTSILFYLDLKVV